MQCSHCLPAQSSAHIIFSTSFQLFPFPSLLQYQKVNLWQWVEITHITELQNSSLWMGSMNVTSPTSCWKQSQLCNQTWLLRALSKYILENLQGWKLHNDFRQPAHCLAVLIVKEFPLIFRLNLSCFILSLMPPLCCYIWQCEQPPSVVTSHRRWGCCWASPEPSAPSCISPTPPVSSQCSSSPWPSATLCSLSRSLLKWESNIVCSFLDMVQQVLSRGS